jgi:hypothetical protein
MRSDPRHRAVAEPSLGLISQRLASFDCVEHVRTDAISLRRSDPDLKVLFGP